MLLKKAINKLYFYVAHSIILGLLDRKSALDHEYEINKLLLVYVAGLSYHNHVSYT